MKPEFQNEHLANFRDPYTRAQIEAALVVADYHGKHSNISPEECDEALKVLNGASLSMVLAWGLRECRRLGNNLRGDYIALRDLCHEVDASASVAAFDERFGPDDGLAEWQRTVRRLAK